MKFLSLIFLIIVLLLGIINIGAKTEVQRFKRDPKNPTPCEKECKKYKHKEYYNCIVKECKYNPVRKM
uniref:SLPTX10 n=1 Tax=Meloidogyne hapla TaxID=6305 RepID=A0A1I8BXH2_MELHA